MTETIGSARRRKRLKWLLLTACVLLLLGSGSLYLLLASNGAVRYRLVPLGGSVPPFMTATARSSISVEVDPGLTQDGLTSLYVNQTDTVDQIAFIQKEKCVIRVRVTAGQQAVDKLSYTIFGADGEKLSQGRMDLKPLKPGESGEGEIVDKELPNASRIVLDK